MLKESKFYKFFDQVRQEAYKIVWPSKKELGASTFIVIIAVLVFSLIFLALDYSIHYVIQILLNL